MEDINQAAAAINAFFSLVGTIGTIVPWALAIGFVVLAVMGLVRPAYRFGKGIAWKKVFIVANDNTRQELKGDLERSGILRKRNIRVKTDGQISDLAGARLLILEYGYLGEKKVQEIVSNKCSDCGVLIYAKHKEISDESMSKLNRSQHVSVVNFRGRLVNEILLLLISTSFARKDVKGQQK
ncbi:MULTISPECIES: hypothetical protein [unclassified Adlercreutzia]|uniref:hypothetical protein n=1 Tax=unclassified Adlercreutzia TaxID=2636013 RepID=UPI0013EB9885|nr:MULTISPECIES: hypothetical protein [unclassified Adlercreutzia]